MQLYITHELEQRERDEERKRGKETQQSLIDCTFRSYWKIDFFSFLPQTMCWFRATSIILHSLASQHTNYLFGIHEPTSWSISINTSSLRFFAHRNIKLQSSLLPLLFRHGYLMVNGYHRIERKNNRPTQTKFNRCVALFTSTFMNGSIPIQACTQHGRQSSAKIRFDRIEKQFSMRETILVIIECV